MGLVTRAQLAELGVGRGAVEHALAAGRLHRIFRGVYALGHPGLTREARWLAAVLACGPGAGLSHLSAAVLWGIWPAEGDAIDVIAGRGRKGQRGIRVHRPRVAPAFTVHRGVPVTTPARTIADLARTFTPTNLERALQEAALLTAFAEGELPARLRPEENAGITRNRMETRFRRIVREAGLPRPEVNVEWGEWEIDFLFREAGVAVETDGRTVHTRRLQFERDRRKDRELQLDGLLVLRFTYADVMRRPGVVRAGCFRACASGPARAWSAASRTR
jgi:very-short-patch-repair endonuclease